MKTDLERLHVHAHICTSIDTYLYKNTHNIFSFLKAVEPVIPVNTITSID